ncbi:CCA tRNA nucleotidyltransferase [Planctomyces sp. SH-PL62]|uniref:CCA tRNA nucleotidyltransferase n=1 Tax=Planctomyces sp. SH-PL62 TaxID=1636152 RepID=UPI00078EA89E|nr:CCA tRNA nucleotidyltransferase [Planctomyces sp. SH-PL62]AMV38458.1 CCA-adding enzyme [Planctomyces sp. SH-PL62]
MAEARARREFAEEVVVRLRQAGYQALWAGGCVRDILLGLSPADYDVATDATPDQVMLSLPYRSLTMGASFGVVRVRHPRQKGNEVEIATFRSDLAYVDGRRPVGVVYSSPREDAERRDFTINGMFMDPIGGEVVDYVGGRADLDARVLRAIGDPASRFEEDKLRLLRAVRFACRFDLRVEPRTDEAIRAMASEVTVVSPERIAQELRRMLAPRSRARAMDALMRLGLIAAVLPPLVETVGLFQGKPMQPEGDLWDHLLLTLELLPGSPSFPLAFAALLHDVGKPATRRAHCGRVGYHNHEAVGARTADHLCRRLKLSNVERERIVWLVANHQYLGEAEKLREAKLKRMLAQPGIDELLALHRADAMATRGHAGHVDYCESYLEHQPTGPINPPPLLTGHDLVRHGLKPGASFAAILDRVREAQLERRIHSKREALDLVDRDLTGGDEPRPAETSPATAD